MPKKILDDTLTHRQTNILFALVKEYCDCGEVIGSKELQEKYHFGFSSATIRNEVSTLRDKGYLFQPFTNAASKPTEKAFKLFVNQLLIGLQVTTRQQKELEKQLDEIQSKHANLSKEISKLLAKTTGGLGFAVSDKTESYSGTKNLLTLSNEDTKVSQILDFLDNLDNTKSFLLDAKNGKEGEMQTYFSDDNPIIPLGRGFAMVSTEITLEDGERTVIGIITQSHLLANKKNLEALSGINKLLTKIKPSKKNKS
jgi:transcriptional regulator of heat shock response